MKLSEPGTAMNAPSACPQCQDPRVAWTGGSPPYGPDHWACDGCGHAWTTGPVLPRPVDVAAP